MTAKRKISSTSRDTKAKATRGTKPKPKKKAKAKEMIQTHAMEEEEKFEKTTLDQVWGDEGLSKYETLEESDYLDQIKFLNRSDLHSHAITIGILPIDNRDILISRLTREFRKHVLSYQKPKKKTLAKGKAKLSQKARRVLSEGS